MGEEIVACHCPSETKYEIAKMSDGERSAVILAANVLTADKGTVFVIDEPERHLHRAIIEPFLSAVFSRRPDCSFVIATHEIALPAVDPSCSVLMVRSCGWRGDLATEWDVDILPSDSPLPEDLRYAILGSRRRLLFVEGTPKSLDCRLYGALFPTVSVIPVGTARDVQDTVKGLRETADVHGIRAFGAIDGDDRPTASIKKLARDGVFVLDTLCVEGLYYCSEAIAAVSSHQAHALGLDDAEINASARHRALRVLSDDHLAIRMAARRSERIVRTRVLSELPSWKSIQSNPDEDISVTVSSPVQDEIRHYCGMVSDGDLDGLVGRYSIRESGAFDCIAEELHCRSRSDYCRMVVSQVRRSDSLRAKLRSRMDTLVQAIDESGDSMVDDS
ncbi:MAG: AAA family ATPase [Bryobacterales bacterium]|nr:AAA family ATPase [Bryobacterales bacterium]